jgi:hypothetical protein
MSIHAYSLKLGGTSKQRICSIAVALASTVAMISAYSCRGSGEGASNQNAESGNRPRTSSAPPAACDNPYYPVEGASRNYRIANRGTVVPTLTYTEDRTNVTFGSFSDHREFSDGVRTDPQWSCTADGLVSSEFAIPAVMRMTTAYKFASVKGSGVAIPAADKWTPGYQWTTSYEVSGEESTRGSQSPGKVSGTIEVKSQIVSSERVTVPAGSFDCFLVDSTIKESLRIEALQGTSRPSLASVKVSAWYAKGVGLVKADFSGDIGTGEQELTTISR